MLYLCRVKPLRHYLRGFLIAAWAGDKIAEFSFPEISFHFPLRPWFFFVSPAYAGKSPARFSSPRRCRDHPRVCGEKRISQSDELAVEWDHPRMCGEKNRQQTGQLCNLGLPPHVRGKDRVELHRGLFGGITPACAGKSARPTPASTAWSDHPRVCGEKCCLLCCIRLNLGSPPRMRGKGFFGYPLASISRITPAYAGKSKYDKAVHPSIQDHPRVCGEKTKKIP